MSNCPHCGLFRYDLSGCICSDKDYSSEWSRRSLDELFNGNRELGSTSKKSKRQSDL